MLPFVCVLSIRVRTGGAPPGMTCMAAISGRPLIQRSSAASDGACLRRVRRTIVPIGLLYSGTLWLGNAAYLYLSVSFIQMLKVRQ